MNLSDFMSNETRDRLIRDSEKDLSPEKKERLRKYRECYFHDTDEMLSYLKKGGQIVPINGHAKEYFYYKNGKVYEHLMVVSDGGVALGYRTDEFTERDFKNDKRFMVRDEGYVMFWQKSSRR